MDKNITDLVETVNFIKDYMVTNMATKEEVAELRKEMKDGFLGVTNRMGGIDNRIDDETFARKDLESRVRVVLPNLPNLPAAPERV